MQLSLQNNTCAGNFHTAPYISKSAVTKSHKKLISSLIGKSGEDIKSSILLVENPMSSPFEDVHRPQRVHSHGGRPHQWVQ